MRVKGAGKREAGALRAPVLPTCSLVPARTPAVSATRALQKPVGTSVGRNYARAPMNAASACLYSLGYTLLMSERAVLAALRTGSDQTVRDHAFTWATNLCATCGVQVHSEGVESVDWSRPLIVMCNHQSLFDIPVVMVGLNRPFGFVTKKELFRIPAFGNAMHRLGCVEIDRRRAASARGALQDAAQRVQDGNSLVVFPEGTRGKLGELLPFKKGPFFLLQAAKVPALPVAMIGTHRVLPKGSLRVRPSEVLVRVGRLVECEGETTQAREAVRVQVREQIEQMMPLRLTRSAWEAGPSARARRCTNR